MYIFTNCTNNINDFYGGDNIFFNRNKTVQKKVDEINKSLENYCVSKDLELNITVMNKLFQDDDTIIPRNIINNNHSYKYCLFYCNGMVDQIILNENIIKPLMLSDITIPEENFIDVLTNNVLLINEVKKTNNMKQVIENVTYGDTILFIDKFDYALILSTKNFKIRDINEPENEKILSGPHEGFNESIFSNLSLIHRKLRTNNLKIKYLKIGEESNTMVCICYLDNIVNKKILNELYIRLNKIKIDGILDSHYINEIIKDAPFSLFRTTGSTERPDAVIGKMLEGRIAIMVDGTPTVLTVPYLFIENFQSSEDYYMNFYYTSFTRFTRILGFILTIMIPAFYVSIVAYHQEMLPTNLFINIAMERQNAPLPAALECFIMLIVFDILKETGIRMPSNIGQALSIVGALVIGQSAVEAKLVAAPMIIVVASTGITSLLVPKLSSPVIFVRFILLALASVLGFYGLLLGISWVIINILNLRSFGVPEITISGNITMQNIKDQIVRTSWKNMHMRPKFITNNRQRMNNNEN